MSIETNKAFQLSDRVFNLSVVNSLNLTLNTLHMKVPPQTSRRHISDIADLPTMSEIDDLVRNCQKLSEIVRKLSEIVGKCRKLSEIVGKCQKKCQKMLA